MLRHDVTIPADLAGLRLDRALAILLPDYSRARLQHWIRCGRARVDARCPRPRDLVQGGERVELLTDWEPAVEWVAESRPLAILYEDTDVIVLDKPAGLVVHPGAGNPTGTLVNALLHHDPALAALPRAGLVHRLDKDTTGVMVVARSSRAHRHLVSAIAARRVRREYQAVAVGTLTAGGTVDAPIGRHPVHRTRMAVVASGKPARTHFRIERRYCGHTHLALVLASGRTHQIRVHLAHIGHPVFGDPLYGGRLRIPAGASTRLRTALQAFRRQALHATRLEFQHPAGATMAFSAPPPADFASLLEALAESESR